jgi:hypothetical protein
MSARLLVSSSLIFSCGLAVLLAAAAVSADPPRGPGKGQQAAQPPTLLPRDEPGPPPSKEEIKKRATELRKKYPFESLSKRLAYEDRFTAASNLRPEPKLNEEAAKHLEALEVAGARTHWGPGIRTKALEMLHSEQVEKFISREGFGLSRLPQPTVRNLELADSEGVRYPRYLLESSEDDKSEFQAPPRPNSSDANPWKLPARDFLLAYHLTGQFDFVGPSGLGLVRDRDHVAGFKPHQFRALPQMVTKWDRDPHAAVGPPAPGGTPLPPPKPVEEWTLRRLELVSLLKHEKPAVYVSATLPKMDDLANAETREPSTFEAASLKSLRSGESLVARATANHLEMVGALRAARQCQACHQVQRGELLGAFSYELHRTPELKAAKSAAAGGG